VKKILIIRFSSIGDIVLTTPVIRCIKKQVENAEIHYITKDIYKSILEANPFIDKLYTINESIWELYSLLKKEKYNYIIDLHRNIRSCTLIALLVRRFSTFNKLNLRKFIYVKFKINLLPDLHIVDRYFNAVKCLNVYNDNDGLDFFINKNKMIDLQTLPDIYHNGYIGFVIGSKHNTKKLPTHKIIEVCKRLDEPVILLGGREDYETGEIIKQAVGNKIFNSCGLFDIASSASIISQAKKIITNDTGLMHIAAAFKKPILSLWGNTVPEFGMYPYLPQGNFNSKIMEIKNLKCRPCSKLGYSKCPKTHFKCMEQLPINEIVEWCKFDK